MVVSRWNGILASVKDRTRGTTLLVLVTAFALFVKCVLFSYMAYHLVIISSLWKMPHIFGDYYFPKIAAAIFFASLLFVIKRKYWYFLILFIVDAWCVANLCYFRISGFMVDAYALSMVGNMDGFWGSSLFLLEKKDMLFPITSIALIPLYIYYAPSNARNIRAFGYAILSAFMVHMCGMACQACETYKIKRNLYNQYEELFHDRKKPCYFDYVYINPFGRKNREASFYEASDFPYQVKRLSILHSPGIIISDLIYMHNDKYEMTDKDINEVQQYIGPDDAYTYSDRIVLLLLESLEDWVIRPSSMPNLYSFINNNEHILYVKTITSQIAQGSSSDGQFIINTGMLPCNEGAVVFRYPTNKYPAWARLAEGKTATIIPHATTVWNQALMSPAYGYDTTIVSKERDEEIYEKVIQCMDSKYQVVQALTLLSHAPFTGGAALSNLQVDSVMPHYMRDYIKCFHYSDACLKIILDKIKNDSIWRNTTLVITGDHTILTPDKREEFAHYCEESGAPYQVEESYCPLIIYSPQIEKKRIIDNIQCYQMDIYPTIMYTNGGGRFFWKGFGRNLLSDTIPEIDVDAQRILSDKLIRSNYFENTIME